MFSPPPDPPTAPAEGLQPSPANPMNVRHLALIAVVVSVVALACASPPPAPSGPSPQPIGCTAEDMYGSEAMLAECTRNLHTLTTAVAEFSARNGGRVPLHLGELGRVPRTCGANRGQDYELKSVDGKTLVICPGTSHSSLGLPPDFPQQAVGGALLLHPALKLRPGSLGLGGVRPGLTAEGLLQTLGPPLGGRLISASTAGTCTWRTWIATVEWWAWCRGRP